MDECLSFKTFQTWTNFEKNNVVHYQPAATKAIALRTTSQQSDDKWQLVSPQVMLYSGESLMTQRPPPNSLLHLRWLVYTVMEACKKSSFSNFTLASEIAQ